MKRKKPNQPPPEVILLGIHLTELGYRNFKREVSFVDDRDWRFDFALEQRRVAIEIEGGIWTSGRHVRGRGYQEDLDKYNRATAIGWRIFRFSVEDVLTGKARATLAEFFANTCRNPFRT